MYTELSLASTVHSTESNKAGSEGEEDERKPSVQDDGSEDVQKGGK